MRVAPASGGRQQLTERPRVSYDSVRWNAEHRPSEAASVTLDAHSSRVAFCAGELVCEDLDAFPSGWSDVSLHERRSRAAAV